MEILRQVKYKPARVAGGYTDQILKIDLNTQEITIEKLPPDFKYKYIGGRGYALKMIWDGTTRKTRYDSPENISIYTPAFYLIDQEPQAIAERH